MLAAASVGLAGSAHAAPIYSHPNDFNARVVRSDSRVPSTPTNNATSGVLQVGLNATTNTLIASAVYFFPLPAESEIGTANLSFYLIGKAGTTPQADVDIYGLGYDAADTPTITGSYAMAYEGTPDNDTSAGVGIPSVVKIEDDFLTATSANAQFHETSDAGDANLASFLKGLYLAGAQAGDFAIIRLNVDGKGTSTDPAWRYEVASQDRSSPNEFQRPFLTVAVPEPASLAGVGLVGAALLARRRRSGR